jgi:hypothetical protein
MHYRRLCALFVLAPLFAPLFAVCTVVGDGVVVKYNHKTLPVPPTEAPMTGEYGLYYMTDTTPQVKYPLKKGERLGFIERDGRVYGVAGDREVPVKTTWSVRTVCWRQM